MANRALKLILVLVTLAGLGACAYASQNAQESGTLDLPLNTGVKDVSFLTDMEKEIIKQLNDVRSNPARFSEYLINLRDKPRLMPWLEEGQPLEGKQAAARLDEAILFLEKMGPLPLFKVSRGLSLAAEDLVKDQGPKGLTGHRGSNGTSPLDRMSRHGKWEGMVGENLSYGYRDADAVVTGMIIDKSMTGIYQKENLFDRTFLLVGVACGTHKTYGFMCAIDFAGSYQEKPELQ